MTELQRKDVLSEIERSISIIAKRTGVMNIDVVDCLKDYIKEYE